MPVLVPTRGYRQRRQVGARRLDSEGGGRPLPSFTILILTTVTHPPHDFIGSPTVTVYHVSYSSYNCGFKFLRVALPSNFPSSVEVLPKADQEGPSRASARLPVAEL